MMKHFNNREVEHDVDAIFPGRWSPRAMSGEKLSDKEILALFEAARWAPSSYNNQPWRFVYAIRETKYFDKLFDYLVDGNKVWCKNAAIIAVLISKKTFDHNGKPDSTHTFSSGCAWENLALQGSIMGLVVHGMAGFDYAKAKSSLDIPDDHDVEMMFVVGKKAPLSVLPEELKKMETPSKRKAMSEILFEGEFSPVRHI